MKTLDQVEARIPIGSTNIPLTISSPGSYYLIENITVEAPGSNGILVTSPDVHIDLNGYTLRGPGAGNSTSGDGIHFSSPTTGTILIRNGTVRDWGSDGLDLLGASDVQVTNVRTANNRVYGITMRTGKVSNCTFRDNGTAGLAMFGGTASSNNFLEGNIGVVTGTVVDSGGVISHNQFQGQTSYAIRINGGNFRVDNNTVAGPDTATGIYVGQGSSIVTRNMVTGHATPYTLHADVTAGPIVSLTGQTLSTQHPLSNYAD